MRRTLDGLLKPGVASEPLSRSSDQLAFPRRVKMAETNQSAAQRPAPTFFARNATGLVREVRIRDATILNALPGGPGVVLAVSIFWILSAFPGANLYLAMLIAAVGAFLVIGAFGLL